MKIINFCWIQTL